MMLNLTPLTAIVLCHSNQPVCLLIVSLSLLLGCRESAVEILYVLSHIVKAPHICSPQPCMASSIPCPADVIPECTQTGSSCSAQHSDCHRNSDCRTQTQTHTFRPSWRCVLDSACAPSQSSWEHQARTMWCISRCMLTQVEWLKSERGALGRGPPSVIPNMHSLFRLHTKGIQSRLKDDGIWLLSLHLRK